MTEEGIRNLVGDMKLPKDALAFLLSQADKTRSDVTRVVTQEGRRVLRERTKRQEALECPPRDRWAPDSGGRRKPTAARPIHGSDKPAKPALSPPRWRRA